MTGLDHAELYKGLQPPWTSEAACAGLPLHRWFSEFDGLAEADHLDAAWEAKLTCFGCPVKIDCLERAWLMNDEYGVFGGLTPLERQTAKVIGFSAYQALGLLDWQILGEREEEMTA